MKNYGEVCWDIILNFAPYNMNNLQNYSEKLLEMELFKKNNAELFQKLENLQEELNELEIVLKEEVREKGDRENEFVKAIKIERYKKYYDYNVFIRIAEEKEIKILEKAKGVNHEIKKEIFDELVNQGLINKDIKQQSFKEELISITVVVKSKL